MAEKIGIVQQKKAQRMQTSDQNTTLTNRFLSDILESRINKKLESAVDTICLGQTDEEFSRDSRKSGTVQRNGSRIFVEDQEGFFHSILRNKHLQQHDAFGGGRMSVIVKDMSRKVENGHHFEIGRTFSVDEFVKTYPPAVATNILNGNDSKHEGKTEKDEFSKQRQKNIERNEKTEEPVQITETSHSNPTAVGCERYNEDFLRTISIHRQMRYNQYVGGVSQKSSPTCDGISDSLSALEIKKSKVSDFENDLRNKNTSFITSLDLEKNSSALGDFHISGPWLVFLVINTEKESKKRHTIFGISNTTPDYMELLFNDIASNPYKQTHEFVGKWVLILGVTGFRTWEEAKTYFMIWKHKNRGTPSRAAKGVAMFEKYKPKIPSLTMYSTKMTMEQKQKFNSVHFSGSKRNDERKRTAADIFVEVL